MIEVIWNMMQEFVVSLLSVLKKNFRLITSLVFLAISILFVCVIESKADAISAIIILYFVSELLKHASRIVESKKDKFPRMKERFTHKKPNGDVYVEKDKLQMAIIYLDLVEDYAESLLKQKR